MPPPADVPQPITDVPQKDVGEVVQRFLDFDDVKNLEVRVQPDGKFTVAPKPEDL